MKRHMKSDMTPSMTSLNKTYLYGRSRCHDELQDGINRIEAQRMVLTQYADESGLENCEFVFDTDYSGLDFERPALGRIIEDVKAGKVSAIAITEIARLGRDYAKVCSMLNLLSENDVRLIVVEREGREDVQNSNDNLERVWQKMLNAFDAWFVSHERSALIV